MSTATMKRQGSMSARRFCTSGSFQFLKIGRRMRAKIQTVMANPRTRFSHG